MKGAKVKKVLYISGSIGLGHVSKDLAIARRLRTLNPGVEIMWLAAHPADLVLEQQGERLHPYSKGFMSYSASAEKSAVGGQLNLVEYVFSSLQGWMRNVKILKQVIAKEKYDLVVGNETYEIIIALVFDIFKLNVPFVMIYDFVGLDAMTNNPLIKIGNHILNWIWSRDRRILTARDRRAIFVGEPEDIPEKKLGFLLPSRRQFAEDHYRFIGYIILFEPEKYRDKRRIRNELGYNENPLVVCSIGGTSIGKGLLELCNETYPLLRERLPNLRMILITGPRLPIESIKVKPGVEVKGFVPELYKHYAACDVAVVQGGFSSTLELTALRRPFIFFPIEGHSEQDYVAERLARYSAGIRMYYSKTTPDLLAKQIISNIGSDVSYKEIATDGAQRAAQIMNELIG